MQGIALEDNFEDVLLKAATGLGFGKQALAEQADIAVGSVDALLRGELEERALLAVAPLLGLDPIALLEMAQSGWQPERLEINGLACFNSQFPLPDYPEMTVNSYLVWSADTGEAVIFDTGTSADGLLEEIEKRNLDLRAVFLTHTHRDHIAALGSIVEACSEVLAYTPEAEPFREALPVTHGNVFSFGSLEVEARSTPGHSPGGMSYVVRGLDQLVAVVGDALFCLSQGGIRPAHYESAMEANRREILALPGNTILCPGHGPLTTVGWELSKNPFYAVK